MCIITIHNPFILYNSCVKVARKDTYINCVDQNHVHCNYSILPSQPTYHVYLHNLYSNIVYIGMFDSVRHLALSKCSPLQS